jgi:hypothetical protein
MVSGWKNRQVVNIVKGAWLSKIAHFMSGLIGRIAA